ncbi:MAG: hypothetical protein FWD69_16285 [Polyangiaceae bacterium]|nr:hypothetical protein [Polyangiaceae bacterium]
MVGFFAQPTDVSARPQTSKNGVSLFEAVKGTTNQITPANAFAELFVLAVLVRGEAREERRW